MKERNYTLLRKRAVTRDKHNANVMWNMIWIDTWGLWDKCSFSLLTSLYYKYVSICIQPLSVTKGNFLLKEHR